MPGAIDIYLDTAWKHFKLQPTWPPGSLLDVGWIGKVKDGQFVPTAELADYGITVRRRTVDHPGMRFASEDGVDFIGSAKGSLSKAVSAVAKADAGLKIAFKKNAAIAIVLDPVTETMIRNSAAVEEWMNGPGRAELDNDDVVVTHVRQAKSGVIAMARTAGAEVQLKTDVALGNGPVELGAISGKFRLVTSSSTEFVSIPSGRSGLTPFYRLLTYADERGKLDRILGLPKETRAGYPDDLVRVLMTRLTLAPYDREFLENLPDEQESPRRTPAQRRTGPGSRSRR